MFVFGFLLYIVQNSSDQEKSVSQGRQIEKMISDDASNQTLPDGLPSREETWGNNEKQAYVKAYVEFFIYDHTQILADFEQKKVYLLKEMYLLQGNENGTYGYIREIKSEDLCPCVYDILNLEVDQGSDQRNHFGAHYECEDEFLSDSERHAEI